MSFERAILPKKVTLRLMAYVALFGGQLFGIDSPIGFSSFENPSHGNHPETWFHLIGGNVVRGGIDADLDATTPQRSSSRL